MIDPLKSYPPGGFGLFRKKEPLIMQQEAENLSAEGAEPQQARTLFRGVRFAGHAALGIVKAASLRLGLHRVTKPSRSSSPSIGQRKKPSARY